jgi:hypothetical protein
MATTISLSLGKTVVLGSTQPQGSNSALILAVRPDLRND